MSILVVAFSLVVSALIMGVVAKAHPEATTSDGTATRTGPQGPRGPQGPVIASLFPGPTGPSIVGTRGTDAGTGRTGPDGPTGIGPAGALGPLANSNLPIQSSIMTLVVTNGGPFKTIATGTLQFCVGPTTSNPPTSDFYPIFGMYSGSAQWPDTDISGFTGVSLSLRCPGLPSGQGSPANLIISVRSTMPAAGKTIYLYPLFDNQAMDFYESGRSFPLAASELCIGNTLLANKIRIQGMILPTS